MNFTVNPNKKFMCAGVIVLKNDNSETIVVKSHKGRYSFPKGKLEKGETYIKGAIREMNEETGLIQEDVELLRDNNGNLLWMEEMSDKGNPSVLYFIGQYIKKGNHKFTLDEKELSESKWHKIDAVYDLVDLKNARKTILLNAIQLTKDINKMQISNNNC